MNKKLFISLIGLLMAACSTFHSRLFLLDETGASLNGLYVFPTIVAFENVREESAKNYGANTFWVEVRIADTLTRFPSRLLEVGQDDPDLVLARSSFRNRVISEFTVDSIFVNLKIPGEVLDSAGLGGDRTYLDKLVTLPVVIDVPGWKWQLIYRFGSIEIPSGINSLTVFIPYKNFDSTTSRFDLDTLAFTMHRYE
ncbi:MAG: hypothetical protein ACREBV_05545, partial [Candidatus Zixiibacteriota bacterium]